MKGNVTKLDGVAHLCVLNVFVEKWSVCSFSPEALHQYAEYLDCDVTSFLTAASCLSSLAFCLSGPEESRGVESAGR